MGKRASDSNEKIQQRSIGLYRWQDDFITENRNFNPSPFCRYAITEQIKILINSGQADKKWLAFIKEGEEDEEETR